MDNFTFNKEVFTESLNNLKNKLSCKDIYNLILKSYNVNISETNDVKKLI